MRTKTDELERRIKLSSRPKVSPKAWLILALLLLNASLFFLPMEKLKPSIFGAVVTKAYISGARFPQECNISLIEDWNLISMNCISNNNSIEYAMSGISDNLTSIHNYILSDIEDHWKSYNPSLPPWVIQDLSQLSQSRGYWVRVYSNSTLYINGTRTNPEVISLSSGYNLIGYPDNESTPVDDALSGLDYTIVWTYNSTDSSFVYYNPSLGTGTISQIEPNVGYWINMSSGGTIVIV